MTLEGFEEEVRAARNVLLDAIKQHGCNGCSAAVYPVACADVTAKTICATLDMLHYDEEALLQFGNLVCSILNAVNDNLPEGKRLPFNIVPVDEHVVEPDAPSEEKKPVTDISERDRKIRVRMCEIIMANDTIGLNLTYMDDRDAIHEINNVKNVNGLEKRFFTAIRRYAVRQLQSFLSNRGKG